MKFIYEILLIYLSPSIVLKFAKFCLSVSMTLTFTN